jgi:hypothetical protein
MTLLRGTKSAGSRGGAGSGAQGNGSQRIIMPGAENQRTNPLSLSERFLS